MIVAFRRRILDRFVLRPTRNELDIGSKQRRWFQSGRHRDEYFVSETTPSESNDSRGGPELLVIKFPGTAGRAERATGWPGQLLENVHVRLCTWNAPGYGRSTGRASLSNIPARARPFVSHLLDQIDPKRTRVWLTGNSLGCATATYLASEFGDRLSGLILRNPPPLIETVKGVADRYPMGRLAHAIAESLPPEMNLHQSAPKVTVPTVMLQSELDELVPPELQEGVFDRLPDPKRRVLLKGIGHAGLINEDHQQDVDEVIGWLWQQSR
ncbi:alpha/beta hydrolase [Roseiconus lacunae]|uniref:alpha/beta hydrolase n=1 Tax=Roseiconus lacunae TaxID=2605694 RepID=UPI0011F305E6|nr:alpha/beta hydrolase [Roseiconus lacunae]WRQ53399.1 alpha/beta hydrolase [Stieleria sp. HD01]